ncbi:dihydrolipoyllysine-residue acetyltransferase component of pyruvate dehydrogenase complex, mitochondrial-like, partial [Lethenteron reissneri]|uniref:dihydrolipoyllysine-residue acetyltransferase component of pyruvate dehydrogenase complex, mitochondrial-like n=1 Tax=Lethenteron reissneri TaxID=7753 RepID=UPI002AB642C7
AKILVADGTRDVPIGAPLCIVVEREQDVALFNDYVEAGADATAPAKVEPAAPPHSAAAPTLAQPPPPSPAAPLGVGGGRPVPRLRQPPRPQAGRGQGPQPRHPQRDGAGGPSDETRRGDVRAASHDNSHRRNGRAPGRPSPRPTTRPPPRRRLCGHPRHQRAQGRGGEASWSVCVDDDDLTLSSLCVCVQVIAARLLQSKQTIPHYYLSVDVTMDEVIGLRKELNE